MTKSGIYTANTSSQTVAQGGTVNIGTTVRRYGCNIKQSGNSIVVDGMGYYKINAMFSVNPDVDGDVTITAYKNGVAIAGAYSTATTTATTQTVVIPIVAMFKKICPCAENESNITFVCSVASAISNVAITVEKV